jgi:hypothetical protein
LWGVFRGGGATPKYQKTPFEGVFKVRALARLPDRDRREYSFEPGNTRGFFDDCNLYRLHCSL